MTRISNRWPTGKDEFWQTCVKFANAFGNKHGNMGGLQTMGTCTTTRNERSNCKGLLLSVLIDCEMSI